MIGASLAGPAAADVASAYRDRLTAYVAARAADSAGDPATAAKLLGALVRGDQGDMVLRRRAIGAAIEAGDMELALQLAQRLPIDQSALDLRLLLVAEELRQGKEDRALELLRTRGGLIDASFLAPFVEAWARAGKRDQGAAEILRLVPDSSALAPQRDEHRALILLKLKRPAEAAPLADLALAKAGGRADRLRLAFADGFNAAGDRATAARMLDAEGVALAVGRARLASGKPIGQAIDNPSRGFAEILLGLALALNKMEDKSLPIGLAQIARYANPSNSAGTLLLGLLLDGGNREADALAVLRTMSPNEPFATQAADAEIRILGGADRDEEALSRAQAFVAASPSADSWSRLGAAYSLRDRFGESADAYARALAMATGGTGSEDPWALHLFRASALEQAGRWDEAKVDMAAAMKLSPDNPLLLNFLGYGQLERGENLDGAEAMVRKASALRPDDASITDSLGWAQFKRGRTDEAIATLQRAAAGDPDQAEIHEHLGDALYTAGRRIEARFAWRAALVNAEDKAKKRLESKLAGGLTPANASP